MEIPAGFPVDYRQLPVTHRGKLVYEWKAAGATNEQIRDWLQVPFSSERDVRRWAARHAKENSLPYPIDVNQYQKWDERNPHLVNMHRDIYMEEDQPRFENAIKNLYDNNDRVCIFFGTDWHFPYEVGQAINVYFDYMYRLQPHIVIRGSDALEGSNLGTFPVTVSERAQDAMGEGLTKMTQLFETENEIVPDATKVWMMGNHDIRYFTWFRQHASQVSDFVERSLIQTIRNLDTYWLGETCDVLSFDELCLSHGVHVGANAVEKMYNEYGKRYLCSAMGHVHRTKIYTEMETGFEFGREWKIMHEAHSVGAMSGIVPHYSRSRARAYKHNLGFFYAFVDPHNHTVEPHNLIIDHNDFSVREVISA